MTERKDVHIQAETITPKKSQPVVSDVRLGGSDPWESLDAWLAALRDDPPRRT